MSKDNFVTQQALKCLAKKANKNVKGKFLANWFFIFVNYLDWIFFKGTFNWIFLAILSGFSPMLLTCLSVWREIWTFTYPVVWKCFLGFFFNISFERKRHVVVITRLPPKTWQIIVECYWFWMNKKILIAFSQKIILLIWCRVLWSQTRRDMVSKSVPEL